MRYLALIFVSMIFSLAYAGEPTAMDKEEAKAFISIAKAGQAKGEFDKALEWLDKAKAKFDCMEVEEMRGLLLEAQKKGVDAKAAFDRAVMLPSIEATTRDRVQAKINEIKRVLGEYQFKKDQYVLYLKSAASSNSIYLSEIAKEDIKKLTAGLDQPATSGQTTPAPTTASTPSGTTKQVDILPNMVAVGGFKIVAGKDGCEFFTKGDQRLQTNFEATPPFTVECEVKASDDFRFYYGKGMLLFNWEMNANQGHLRGPDEWNNRTVFSGRLADGVWHKLVWVVGKDSCKVLMDGAVATTNKGQFGTLKGPLGITSKGTAIIKSLKYSTSDGNADEAH